MCGVLNWVGVLPLARVECTLEEEGWRCARRYGCGESFAKVSLGKDRVEGGPADDIGEDDGDVCLLLRRGGRLMKMDVFF